jgi:hypothetical protein
VLPVPRYRDRFYFATTGSHDPGTTPSVQCCKAACVEECGHCSCEQKTAKEERIGPHHVSISEMCRRFAIRAEQSIRLYDMGKYDERKSVSTAPQLLTGALGSLTG